MAFGRQLADAVTRYAAELAKIAAGTGPRLPARTLPGRRRDGGRSRRGGWSWYLRPPLGSLP